MANPQKENGFTSIANELLEAILKSDLSLRELKIVLCVIRFTYGFNRKSAELSLRFISTATNIQHHHVSKTIKILFDRNVLVINKNYSVGKDSRVISLNKNYESWISDSSQKSNIKIEVDSSQKSNIIVPKKVTIKVPKRVTKKEKKENIKKAQLENFSIDYLHKDLNGELFYQTQFFFVTTSLVNEFKEKLGIKINDDLLKTEFYKMEEWLKKNGAKKDYKRFFINWLSKLKPEQPKQETLVWS